MKLLDFNFKLPLDAFKKEIEQFVKTNGIEALNEKNEYGDTLLHPAMIERYFEYAKVLIAAGANPEVTNRENHTAWDVGKYNLSRKHLAELQTLSKSLPEKSVQVSYGEKRVSTGKIFQPEIVEHQSVTDSTSAAQIIPSIKVF